MTKILRAQPAVDHIKTSLSRRCKHLNDWGKTPSMKVVLVGSNPASLSYIKNKKKICEEVGAKFDLLQLPDNVTEKEFLGHIKALNENPAINGIIIQLPVSESLKKLDIANLVIPQKDIDGFHHLNTKSLYEGSTDLSKLLPCTPKGVLRLLDFYGIPVSGKKVVIAGRSLIVGKPLSMMMSNLDATVTLTHSKTPDLKSYTREADIVVSAMGKAHYFDETFFDPKKNSVVIDVGMNSLNGKLVGDVHFEKVAPKVRAITPVPGGVGPMTVVSLIENLISATEKQLKG